MTPARLLQIAMVIIVLGYPLLAADSPVYGRLGALVLLAAIGASAWNIVGGYAGQVSVGHAVFFGIGAYASVTSFVHLGLPPIAGAPIGMLVSVLVAAVIGVPTLRLSGHYFSMATIAVGELVRVLSSTSDFLGGAQGLGGPAMPRSVFDLSFVSATPYYYIFLGVLAGLFELVAAEARLAQGLERLGSLGALTIAPTATALEGRLDRADLYFTGIARPRGTFSGSPKGDSLEHHDSTVQS
jgi:branched-chain amino acid transport system permease protein